ncbi:dual 3',5'-cyclic-AMP and -GMP phosphodiesterase 11 [Caerostris extrusa]|uniref:Dual 3',5'-cyclic-AMP and -GMP phosphodiesterase 11 n=1 Tax=Caerostris extrusa TaxID=172846 RepID=A0AAV4QS23_CAEEX|nr:dual 3',5'-cyclic-AMP and -GMP phosphodiesterase 11 [Caerostris extrusa]
MRKSGSDSENKYSSSFLLTLAAKNIKYPRCTQEERFDPSIDEGSNFRHHSILCMPVRNASKNIVGVSQIINKLNGISFTKNDENIFEIFTIFCGLGIQNIQIQERTMKAIAKTEVTLEVLSYHATAPLEEVQELLRETVSAPPLALRQLRQLASDEEKIFPMVVPVIRNDILNGTQTLKETTS